MDISRTVASAIMWITYLAIVALSISALGMWAILLAFVLMMPLMGAMGIMWNNENLSVKSGRRGFIIETKAKEKRKAVPIDSVFNNIDDDDLSTLREQLMYNMDEEIYYDYFADDDDLLIEKH